MAAHEHRDPKFGHVYKYHPRSDSHSVALCNLVMNDLLTACFPLREQVARGEVVYGVNVAYRWPSSHKVKTIDLAVGRPIRKEMTVKKGIIRQQELDEVLISCEAKAVMTEHKKSQPRLYDELNSSHRIVHEGRRDAIAAGITVVNIASTFVSPLRNQNTGPLFVSVHKQPHAAAKMVEHLRGLPIRDGLHEEGFDAYCSIVVDCDNQTGCDLWTRPPAPQPGDRDYYDTFIDRLARFYAERFGKLT